MSQKKIINIIAIAVILIYLGWKYSESLPGVSHFVEEEKVWVYIEVQTKLVRDTSDYYYYGQINKSIVDKIDNDKDVGGMFKLSNIRYWTNDDLFKLYNDEEDYGYKIFRIQDIQYITFYKKDPIYLFELEDLHESTKKLRI